MFLAKINLVKYACILCILDPIMCKTFHNEKKKVNKCLIRANHTCTRKLLKKHISYL